MKKFIMLIMSVALLSMTFTSCSNDDEPETKPGEKPTPVIVDELAELQDNLTILNEDGSLNERLYGVVLDESKPNTVSVGVESFDEAREIFTVLFADTTSISADGTKAQFSTRQGSAELKQDNGKNGLIAHIDFNVEGLKYVDQVNFISQSAWPDNAQSNTLFKLGKTYTIPEKDGDMYPFICIREYSKGSPALLLSIIWGNWSKSPTSYFKYLPTESEAHETSKVLRGNWDYYKSLFGGRLTDGERYWIKKGDGFYDWAICLQTDKTYKLYVWVFSEKLLKSMHVFKGGIKY